MKTDIIINASIAHFFYLIAILCVFGMFKGAYHCAFILAGCTALILTIIKETKETINKLK